jgi:ribosome-binding ATPase YchF (GTP1/OBG family)
MLEEEFDLWLTGILGKDWEKIARTAQAAREEIGRHLEEKLTGLGMNRFHIAEAVEKRGLNPHAALSWSSDDIHGFASELRKASKPLIVAANKADKGPAEENVRILKEAGYQVVPTCAEAELTLRRAAAAGLIRYTPGDSDFEIPEPEKLSGGQRKALELIREKVLTIWGSTGVQDIINSAFIQLLNTILVYPVEDAEKLTDHQGRVLPDCYLVPQGTTAKQFASLIHTELGESFIFAIDARTKKRLGEGHELNKDDIIQIVAAKSRR